MSSSAARKKVKENTEKPVSDAIPFAAETSKVLHLMIHSLYTNKDIFLRELVSNASDACDKLRYEAAQDDALMAGDGEFSIRIAVDEQAKTISVSDNGIGMNRDDLIAHLGTIAKSGTQEFFAQLTGDAKKDTNLIGQFGVGFYSSFIVAEKVDVYSRKAGEEQGWKWSSDGEGSFTVEEADEQPRGTQIVLYIREEAKDYLDSWKLRHIIQTYSDHIAFPISIAGEDGKEEVVNDGSAIWTRPQADITDEQYREFYHHVSHSPDEPWLRLHNKAEGVIEYTSLLFIPSIKPFDLFHPERRSRVKLYVKRVFITDEGIELIPPYLRFLRGVIDSQDLPLNISRETLQHNAVLHKIRDAVTKKVLSELAKRAKKDETDYASFWQNFGAVLKEGLCEATAPREKILEACRFASTHESGALTSLDAYKQRMKEDQEAIYYIVGDDVESLQHSPQIEGFRKYGIEVLLLTDHVDDFWTGVTGDYKDTPLRSVVKAGDDLERFHDKDEADTEDTKETQEDKEEIAGLMATLKEIYGDQVRDVRITHKLAESPVCLAVGEGDMDMRMERFLLEHKQLPQGMAKILEINPDHTVIKALAAKANDKVAIEDHAMLLLDQARLQEGEPVSDIAAYGRRMTQLLEKAITQ